MKQTIDYFGEKTSQVSSSSLDAFGIDITSRYGKAWELIEMLQFAQAIAQHGLHTKIKSIFYDSKATYCTFEFFEELDESSLEAALILEAAETYISQFDWFGCCKHGGEWAEEEQDSQEASMPLVDLPTGDAEALNVVQEVLRGFMSALVFSGATDPAKLSHALEEFIGPPGLQAASKTMLLDLAKGASILARVPKE